MPQAFLSVVGLSLCLCTLGVRKAERVIPTYLRYLRLRGSRARALGLFRALTFSGKKDLIPEAECFAFETPASSPASPTEKGARRAVVKPTWRPSDSEPGLGVIGLRERRPPPLAFPRVWISDGGASHKVSRLLSDRSTFPGRPPSRPLGAHARPRLPGVHRARWGCSRPFSAGGSWIRGAAEPGKPPGPPKAGALRASSGHRRRGRVSAPVGGCPPPRRLGGYQGNATIFMTSGR